MDCIEVRELLSPMSDREIAAEELRLVEEHLRNCKECAFQSSMMVGLKKLLGKWDGVHASERFRANVLERVRREPSPKKANWISWALGGGLATVCVVVLVLAVALPVDPKGPDAPVGTGAPGAGSAAGAVAPRSDEGVAGERPARPTPPPDTTASSAVPVAQFRIISKAVQLERPGAFPALATVGDVVAPGSAVSSPEKGFARLALLAGLFMRIEGGGHVVFEGDHACELRAGRLLLCTKDRAKRPHPYAIRSGAVTVEARDVERALVVSMDRLASGALRLTVAEGEAGVVHAGGRRTVGRGETVEFAADGNLSEAPTAADAGEIGRLRRWGEL